MSCSRTLHTGLTVFLVAVFSTGLIRASSDAGRVRSDQAKAPTIVAQSEQCQVTGDIATVTAPADGNCICPSGTLRAGERPLGPLGSGKFFCSPIW